MKEFLFETAESKALKQIYERLQDDESREIYVARSLFSLTDNRMYMKEIVRSMSVSKYMLAEIAKHPEQKKVLYGAGTWGDAISLFFPDIDWSAVADKNFAPPPHKCIVNNIPGISLEELLSNYSDACIVVAVLFKFEEVLDWLLAHGFKRQNIIVLGQAAEEFQYFDLPALAHTKDEVFVDAGAFDGRSSEAFIKWSCGDYRKIFLFEPGDKCMSVCKRRLFNVTGCKFISKGVWCKETKLGFIEDGEGSRIIENEPDGGIFVTSLDKELAGENVTFIKMDIEGSELQALEGARDIIANLRPKLAISIYHRRQDIWKIPQFILSLCGTYTFYLRTYSFTGNDTVLYAIP